MSRVHAILLLCGYALFILFSLVRGQYSCPCGISREWVVFDTLVNLIIAAVLSAYCRAALSASGLPDDLDAKLADVLQGVARSEAALSAIQTVASRSIGSWQPSEPAEPQAPAEPDIPQLTSRQVVLSNGIPITVRMRRDAPNPAQ